MTYADHIPLPSGPRRCVDVAIAAARAGLRALNARYRAGANDRPGVAHSLMLARRLMRMLRFVFAILAVHLARSGALKPTRKRGTSAGTSMAIRKRPAKAGAPFPLLPRYRVAYEDAPKQAQPHALKHAIRDPFRTLQNKLDALAQALAAPMPLVRRLARRLPTALLVIGWRPPKRPPPTARRAHWDDLCAVWGQATYDLGEFRRARRDSS